MLLFLGCIRPGFGAVQHLHSPCTHFSPVRDRAVTGWTVRNQGTKDQPPLLEMFAYMNPQAGWKTKITSSKNWDGSSQRGWGRSGQACLARAKWAPLPRESEHKRGLPHSTPSCCPLSPGPRSCAWALLPFSPVSPIPFGVNHHRHDPQGHGGAASSRDSPGQALQARCARRSQGSCLHCRHGYLSLKARASPAELFPARDLSSPAPAAAALGAAHPLTRHPRTPQPGPSHPAPRILSLCTPHPGSPAPWAPVHPASPAHRTTLHPPRPPALWIPCTPDPQHPGPPGTPEPWHPGSP